MNKMLIKESAITWLTNAMAEADEYSSIKIMGTFGENKIYPIVTCAVGDEKPVTDKYNGLLPGSTIYENLILYKSWFSWKISIFATIDDEADRIAEIIVDRIREYNYPMLVDGIEVEEISDRINVVDAAPRDLSGEKKFAAYVIVPILCYEIKTIIR